MTKAIIGVLCLLLTFALVRRIYDPAFPGRSKLYTAAIVLGFIALYFLSTRLI